MKEFFNDKPDEMFCIILLKSGILKLVECTFTLNGIANIDNRKVPCITVLNLGGSSSTRNGTKLEMINCKMKGDELANEHTQTAGIVSVDADISIRGGYFENFKSGAIMIQAKKWNEVELTENEIMSCDTNGIYVQGKESQPLITNNYFGFCKCAAITTNLEVNAIVSNSLLHSLMFNCTLTDCWKHLRQERSWPRNLQQQIEDHLQHNPEPAPKRHQNLFLLVQSMRTHCMAQPRREVWLQRH